jgi:FMN phosphatase YigB (HAD superfamily)
VWTAYDHEDLGLGDYLDCSILSCYVGTAKPSREIFDLARAAFGCNEQEAVYVGNNLEYDILPALRAGWNAVLVDRSGRTSHGPVRSVPSLLVLPEAIAELQVQYK